MRNYTHSAFILIICELSRTVIWKQAKSYLSNVATMKSIWQIIMKNKRKKHGRSMERRRFL